MGSIPYLIIAGSFKLPKKRKGDKMNKTGLIESEVLDSRKKYGDNRLPEPKLKSAFSFFMDTFKDKLNLILLCMLIVFTIMAVLGQGSLSEPAGIAVVLVSIAFIGMNTNLKSQKSTKELRDKTAVHYCNVLRSGKIQILNTDDIVVGDIIFIESGEAIYADGYLLEGTVHVDNSVLNGESKECLKSPIKNYGHDPNKIISGDDYVDQNSLFAGAIITEGEGKMVVTKVGVNTVNGQTITAMHDVKEKKTSLEIQLSDLADQISKFGYIGALVITIALLGTQILNYGFSEYFSGGWMLVIKNILTIITTALTIIVAAVPEGLPLIINIITAQNAKVMLKNNILAKHTNKIPECGNIQLLCTDKTGTLTCGKLIPVKIINGAGEEIPGKSELRNIFNKNIVLNSSSMLGENGKALGGNATERALLTLVSNSEYIDIKESVAVVDKLPFNSQNKFSSITVKEESRIVTLYKGAPEKLLRNASTYVDNTGKKCELNREIIEELIKNFTSKAMRVIATAYYNGKTENGTLPDNLIITAFVAIRDDVRAEVPEAVKEMNGAGVQVMMVTGDVLDTAKAIAVDAGLITKEDDIMMSANEFDDLSDTQAKNLLPRIKVIARATPKTKLRIVQLAQELNLCVGMTGDGTNDAPALKAADVGFSMGSGTDVCKEAGDIIITDDNFVSITASVLLGRTFMHNVLKFLKFQLPINVSMVLLSILYPILFGVEAIAAVQILVINIIMDGLNSLSFGGEPSKKEYMLERPIPKGAKLLNKETVCQIAVSTIGFIIIFMITAVPGIRNIFGSEEHYLTVRFAMLVIMATINGFNIRTDHLNLMKGIEKNKLFIKVALSIFVGVALLVTFGGSLIHTTSLTLNQWLLMGVLSVLIVPIDIIRKILLKIKEKESKKLCQSV